MRMKKTVAVLGTFDTKGQEFQYLMECLRDFQISVVTIDVGTGDPVSVVPDYRAAESPACRCTKRPPKEEWMEMLAREAASYLEKLIGRREVDGVISMGGGQGTFLANRVFRTLPVGMPKVLMSTLALLKDSAEQQRRKCAVCQSNRREAESGVGRHNGTDPSKRTVYGRQAGRSAVRAGDRPGAVQDA